MLSYTSLPQNYIFYLYANLFVYKLHKNKLHMDLRQDLTFFQVFIYSVLFVEIVKLATTFKSSNTQGKWRRNPRMIMFF